MASEAFRKGTELDVIAALPGYDHATRALPWPCWHQAELAVLLILFEYLLRDGAHTVASQLRVLSNIYMVQGLV